MLGTCQRIVVKNGQFRDKGMGVAQKNEENRSTDVSKQGIVQYPPKNEKWDFNN